MHLLNHGGAWAAPCRVISLQILRKKKIVGVIELDALLCKETCSIYKL